jgi:glycosyltransferase involved in cell wall biosynthesis
VSAARGVPDTIVFIPAWNEAASLPALLEEAGRDLPEAYLLVIDDRSTDDTAAVARAGGAQVVTSPRTPGCGTGLPRATGSVAATR